MEITIANSSESRSSNNTLYNLEQGMNLLVNNSEYL